MPTYYLVHTVQGLEGRIMHSSQLSKQVNSDIFLSWPKTSADGQTGRKKFSLFTLLYSAWSNPESIFLKHCMKACHLSKRKQIWMSKNSLAWFDIPMLCNKYQFVLTICTYQFGLKKSARCFLRHKSIWLCDCSSERALMDRTTDLPFCKW